MKKITVLLSGMALVFGLAACGSRQQEKDVPVPSAEPVLGTESGETDLESSGQTEAEQENFENSEQNGHVLIACFSVPEDVDVSGVDAIASASVVVQEGALMGNTEYVARIIQNTVGGDLFRIILFFYLP